MLCLICLLPQRNKSFGELGIPNCVFGYQFIFLCEQLGHEKAFQKHTKIDKKHIIYYSSDELFDKEGNSLD